MERQNAGIFEPEGDSWLTPSSESNDWSSWDAPTSDPAIDAEGQTLLPPDAVASILP